MTDSSAPPTLNYERVLYAGGAPVRSWGGVSTWVTLTALTAAGGGAATGRLGEPQEVFGRLVSGGGAAVVALWWAWLSFGIVTGRLNRFELTTTGIRRGRRFDPWSRVIRVVT